MLLFVHFQVDIVRNAGGYRDAPPEPFQFAAACPYSDNKFILNAISKQLNMILSKISDIFQNNKIVIVHFRPSIDLIILTLSWKYS